MKKTASEIALKNEQRKNQRDKIVGGLKKQVELSKRKESIIDEVEYLKPISNPSLFEEYGYKSYVNYCERTIEKHNALQTKKLDKIEQLEKKLEKSLEKHRALVNKKKQKKTEESLKVEAQVVEKNKKNIAKVVSKFEQKLDKLHSTFTSIKEKKIYHLKLQVAKSEHKIKMENELCEWDILPIEEKKEVLTSVSFYRTDVFGYWMILLGIVFELIYIVMCLSVMPRDYLVGIMIMFNIVTLLLLFTCALKVKVYVKTFSIISIVFGAYNLLRLSVVVPFILKIDYSQIEPNKTFIIILCQIAMAVTLCAAGIVSLIKVKRKEKYIADGKITTKQMSR